MYGGKVRGNNRVLHRIEGLVEVDAEQGAGSRVRRCPKYVVMYLNECVLRGKMGTEPQHRRWKQVVLFRVSLQSGEDYVFDQFAEARGERDGT